MTNLIQFELLIQTYTPWKFQNSKYYAILVLHRRFAGETQANTSKLCNVR